MPHVSEWEGFHFGGSVMGSSGRRLGRVVHPVKKLLKAGDSGNAVLASNNDSGGHSPTVHEEEEESNNDDYISVCRPAHLAQNKFVSLLLNEAKQRHAGSSKCNNLRYGEEVTAIEGGDLSSRISITTNHFNPNITRSILSNTLPRSCRWSAFLCKKKLWYSHVGHKYNAKSDQCPFSDKFTVIQFTNERLGSSHASFCVQFSVGRCLCLS